MNIYFIIFFGKLKRLKFIFCFIIILFGSFAKREFFQFLFLFVRISKTSTRSEGKHKEKRAKQNKREMNMNFKKSNTSQTMPPPPPTPSTPAFYSRSQSTSASFSAILSTNSSTLIESYDPIGFFGPSSPILASPKPQSQHSEAASNLFYENFPRQSFFPQIAQLLPQQTIYQQQQQQNNQQYFQAFNQCNNYQSVVMPTFFADHFTSSTPTSSCYSPATHISTSPIDLSYLNEMNAPTSNSFEEKLDEMTNKLNNLISECNLYNHSGNKSCDSNRNTPDTAYASSSLSDWSDTPKISKVWSSQNSNNNSYENEANRSYLSSPRPIRAIKKSQNINVIGSKIELDNDKKNECLSKFNF